MGIGDDIIATSLARGAKDRGELIAFGDCRRILWGPYSEMIFRHNQNIARPGQEKDLRVRWIKYYKGNRIYNASSGKSWIWNYKFKVKPGELFFEDIELIPLDNRLIIIEPNVPKKRCAPNKQWPLNRWKYVAEKLMSKGWKVCQFEYGAGNIIVPGIRTPTFRHAAAVLKSARLAILPEGGLHHAAAAVGKPAIVLFGGFTPPEVLGYDGHVNFTGGARACGSFDRCQHCVDAMDAIHEDMVLRAAERLLNGT